MTDRDSSEAVHAALCQRIRYRADLLDKYGIERVMRAIDEKAAGFKGVQLEEIGSSDVSCWVKDIEESFKPEDVLKREPLTLTPSYGTARIIYGDESPQSVPPLDPDPKT